MKRKRAPMDFYSRKARKYRRVLELAMDDVSRYERKQMRVIFATLEGLNYNVLGYRTKLEMAIKYIQRAENAIKALEI